MEELPVEPTDVHSVLLVDCFADAAQAYARYLRHHGYDIVTECEGSLAFCIAATAQPDVIVSDVTLHHHTGVELIRRLRADTRTRGCLIVILSGHAEDHDAAERAGCDVFVTKPCSAEQLGAEIGRGTVRRR